MEDMQGLASVAAAWFLLGQMVRAHQQNTAELQDFRGASG